MKTRATVVLKKELVDNLRDRRSLFTALFFALLGPLMLIPLLGLQGRLRDRGSANLIDIAVEGAERAPALVEYLRQRNIEVHPAPADPAKAVRDLADDLVLVVPPSYADDFRAGRPATVRIVADTSRTSAVGRIGRVSGALEAYSQTVGALRLIARGVSPTVESALAIAVDDVAGPESEGAQILGIIPMFLVTALFFGGVYVAVDVTAGERERGSLEPLMATPLSAAEIVLGKLGAVLFFGFATTLAALVAFTIVVNLPFKEIPGLKFQLSALGALEIFGSLVPLLLPIAALQMIVASGSRSVKEAYTATSICSIVPMLAGFFLVFSPFKATTSAMTVPVLAQNLIMNAVLSAQPVRPLDYILAAVTATALGLVLAAIAVARSANARLLSSK